MKAWYLCECPYPFVPDDVLAQADSVRASLRVMVKTLLRRYKYPPDKQEEATETVLKQAEMLSAEWV